MMLARTCITTPSLRCLATGALVTTSRKRQLAGPGSCSLWWVNSLFNCLIQLSFSSSLPSDHRWETCMESARRAGNRPLPSSAQHGLLRRYSIWTLPACMPPTLAESRPRCTMLDASVSLATISYQLTSMLIFAPRWLARSLVFSRSYVAMSGSAIGPHAMFVKCCPQEIELELASNYLPGPGARSGGKGDLAQVPPRVACTSI